LRGAIIRVLKFERTVGHLVEGNYYLKLSIEMIERG